MKKICLFPVRKPASLISIIVAALSTGFVAAAPGFAEDTVVPGGIYIWPVPPEADKVRFGNKPVMVYQQHAVVGIPIKQPVGPARLTYTHQGQSRTHTFTVSGKQYSEQHITLENQNMVTPPEETLVRIRREASRQRALYNQQLPSQDLSAGFVKPLQGITTSLFGHQRFFNGQPRNPHSGLDIAADTGTPIQAAANATVSLADDLYFNGKTLFLDHGDGLVTMYCHMSELLVKEGDRVVQGQNIGKVGTTGRVTGPHLHWSVSLNGSRVDPLTFLAEFNSLVKQAGR